MRSIVILLFLCTLTFGQSLLAPARAAVDKKDVIATVEGGYNSLTDLQASFSQKTYVPSLKREQTGNGTLFIRKRPGGAATFRFDYARPKQLIVSDGKTVWFYLPENRQVMQTSVKGLFEGDNGIALNYLTGMGRISRDFAISQPKNPRDSAGNYLLDLVPKKPSRGLARLQLAVSAEAVGRFLKEGTVKNIFPIVSSVITDPMGTRTSITYGNVKVNRGLKGSLFEFKVPEGVEVVKP